MKCLHSLGSKTTSKMRGREMDDEVTLNFILERHFLRMAGGWNKLKIMPHCGLGY
jgi:hypothetical protein